MKRPLSLVVLVLSFSAMIFGFSSSEKERKVTSNELAIMYLNNDSVDPLTAGCGATFRDLACKNSNGEYNDICAGERTLSEAAAAIDDEPVGANICADNAKDILFDCVKVCEAEGFPDTGRCVTAKCKDYYPKLKFTGDVGRCECQD